ncbi:MAG: hypothetical protein GYB65_03140, partial [Chloroflexi bacterium]|nr:hypothetical protein [Chloroflexota bacterium]
ASKISGYWVQLVQGLVMGASVILNVLVGEGRMAELSQTLQRWGITVGSRAGQSSAPSHIPLDEGDTAATSSS